MAKHKTTIEEEPTLPEQPEAQPETETQLVEVNDLAVRSLFRANGGKVGTVKNITVKTVLTRPLKAMSHEKELVFSCTGEMYTMTLPAKGRGSVPTLARVVDGIDIGTAEECTLILNEMMVGAFQRGGFRTLQRDVKDGETVGFNELAGERLTGHSFAFQQGALNEDKGYRVVNTVEVSIEY